MRKPQHQRIAGKTICLATLAVGLLLGGGEGTARAQDQPTGAAHTYSNPILDQNFADPAALRDGDTLYAYATGAIGGGYFPVSHSTDFVTWTPPTPAMTAKPSWASGKGFWAPDVIADRGADGKVKRYLMYYTAVAAAGPQRRRGHCLDVAVSASPSGPFQELMEADGVTPRPPLVCGLGYRNIDPAPFHDINPASAEHGKWYLFWGSEQGQPVLRKQLSSADITKWENPSAAPEPVLTTGAMGTYQHLREGAYVIFRTKEFTKADSDYYYLFTSGFNCCPALPVHNAYAVSVARSRSVDGPWTPYAGPAGSGDAILHFNSTWGNPGGNGVFQDGAGNDWMLYHARPDAKKERVLLMDPIVYVDGWPRVNPNAASPDSPSISGQQLPARYHGQRNR